MERNLLFREGEKVPEHVRCCLIVIPKEAKFHKAKPERKLGGPRIERQYLCRIAVTRAENLSKMPHYLQVPACWYYKFRNNRKLSKI